MADWQVGDLAVCVDATPVRGFPLYLTQGATYTVTGLHWSICPHYGPGLGLDFAEIESVTIDGYYSGRFRKIRPDEYEACEPEFVTLLKRIRESANA